MSQGISITGRKYNIDSNNPSPVLDNAAKQWIYIPTQDRVMYTIAEPSLSYVFQAPPTQFQLEGFGAELNEIQRPYAIPIADITGGKLRRLSFEFAVVKRVQASTNIARRPANFPLRETTPEYIEQNRNNPNFNQPIINRSTANFSYYDGFSNSIEDQIFRLRTISDLGVPVAFENMSNSIQENAWYVDNMTFNITRDDATGNAVAASCSISCIEYKELRQRFILLPRFRYGVPSASSKKRTTPGGGGPGSAANLYWLRKALEQKIDSNKANGVPGYPYSVQDLLRGLQVPGRAIPPYIDIPQSLINEIANYQRG